MKQTFLKAGRIVNTFGTAGEVKIIPWIDRAEYLQKFDCLFVDGAPRRVLRSRVHKGALLALLEGAETMDAAAGLKNKIVSIAREGAPPPSSGFFAADLVGLNVVEEDGNVLGQLYEVLQLPQGNVYVVKGEREVLVPAVPEFVLNTDLENGVLTVRLLEDM